MKHKDPEIVQFEDNLYAIRKTTGGKVLFKDLKSTHHWWSKDDSWFKDCTTSSLLKAKKELINIDVEIHKKNIRRRERLDMGKPVIETGKVTVTEKPKKKPTISKPNLADKFENVLNMKWFKD